MRGIPSQHEHCPRQPSRPRTHARFCRAPRVSASASGPLPLSQCSARICPQWPVRLSDVDCHERRAVSGEPFSPDTSRSSSSLGWITAYPLGGETLTTVAACGGTPQTMTPLSHAIWCVEKTCKLCRPHDRCDSTSFSLADYGQGNIPHTPVRVFGDLTRSLSHSASSLPGPIQGGSCVSRRASLQIPIT